MNMSCISMYGSKELNVHVPNSLRAVLYNVLLVGILGKKQRTSLNTADVFSVTFRATP